MNRHAFRPAGIAKAWPPTPTDRWWPAAARSSRRSSPIASTCTSATRSTSRGHARDRRRRARLHLRPRLGDLQPPCPRRALARRVPSIAAPVRRARRGGGRGAPAHRERFAERVPSRSLSMGEVVMDHAQHVRRAFALMESIQLLMVLVTVAGVFDLAPLGNHGAPARARALAADRGRCPGGPAVDPARVGDARGAGVDPRCARPGVSPPGSGCASTFAICSATRSSSTSTSGAPPGWCWSRW